MTKNLLSSAVLAGVAAGLIAALLQFWFVIPTLLEGELYETGARVHFATDGSTQSEKGAPALGSDMMRHAMTIAFNLVTFTGYGLILLAAMIFAHEKGHVLSARKGIIWGLAGFVAVQLAPAIGLPPELPGTPAAEVGPRQIWWASTIIATALGLAFMAFGRGSVALLCIPLILVPHLIGAPHLDTYFGIAPPELSAHFVTLSLGVALVGWSFLGFFCAWFWTKANDG
ncbi:MAG: CbtA family protein [Planktotalea sp.]|uniref:CbtA family protein n=1 Tax=Planktotalea sp. TaxID=2029877 RepID=UPI003C74302E